MGVGPCHCLQVGGGCQHCLPVLTAGGGTELPALVKWPLLVGSSWLWVCYLLPWQAALLEAELWQAHSLLIPVELHAGGWVMQFLSCEVLGSFWSDGIAGLVQAGCHGLGSQRRIAAGADELTTRSWSCVRLPCRLGGDGAGQASLRPHRCEWLLCVKKLFLRS